MRDEPQLRILYVDDNDNDHKLFRRAIDRMCPGCDLREASDPTHALNQITTDAMPHVVLTDGSFHGTDGPAFIQQLRHRFPSVPVIALSGRTDQDTINRCYAAGVSAYFVKPVEFSALLETVRVITRFLEQARLPQFGRG
jgi:CheY-like chemotaxis protein